jgi:hypothetical protein
MPRTYYSVIQYVPDQFADERVNVGLVVLSPESGYAQVLFPDSERRARRLNPSVKLDITDRLQRELEARLPAKGYQGKLGLTEAMSVQELTQFHEERGNLLQFTEPKPSSADPKELTERLAAIYLPPLPHWRRARGTPAVRGAIRRAITGVGLAQHLRPEFSARGKHDLYTFSFGLENGKVHHIIEALSLSRVNKEAVREDLYATAYRFEDLRRANFEAPLSLVVGSAGSEMLKKARSIMSDVPETMVVAEEALPRWANRVEREFVRDEHSQSRPPTGLAAGQGARDRPSR